MSKVHAGEPYALRLPAGSIMTLRGLEMMIQEHIDYYEGPPTGVLMTQYQLDWLYHDASLRGVPLWDREAGEMPTFMGVPIAVSDLETSGFAAEIIDREE